MRQFENLKIERLVIVLVSVFLTFTGISQNKSPLIQQEDIPELKILEEKEYTGKSLWGYINGGADLYLEYGFEKLTAQEVEKDDILFNVNIYKMEDAKAAFGIFSVNVHKCKNRNVILEHDCQGPYQYQAFKDKYYISVLNDKGSKELEGLSIKVGKVLLQKISDVQPSYPDLFISTELKELIWKLKFAKGLLGINNIIPDWSDLFDDLNSFNLWLLPLDDAKIAFVMFKDNDDRSLFISRLNSNVKHWNRNNKTLIVLDCSTNSSANNEYSTIISDYLKNK